MHAAEGLHHPHDRGVRAGHGPGAGSAPRRSPRGRARPPRPQRRALRRSEPAAARRAAVGVAADPAHRGWVAGRAAVRVPRRAAAAGGRDPRRAHGWRRRAGQLGVGTSAVHGGGRRRGGSTGWRSGAIRRSRWPTGCARRRSTPTCDSNCGGSNSRRGGSAGPRTRCSPCSTSGRVTWPSSMRASLRTTASSTETTASSSGATFPGTRCSTVWPVSASCGGSGADLAESATDRQRFKQGCVPSCERSRAIVVSGRAPSGRHRRAERGVPARRLLPVRHPGSARLRPGVHRPGHLLRGRERLGQVDAARGGGAGVRHPHLGDVEEAHRPSQPVRDLPGAIRPRGVGPRPRRRRALQRRDVPRPGRLPRRCVAGRSGADEVLRRPDHHRPVPRPGDDDLLPRSLPHPRAVLPRRARGGALAGHPTRTLPPAGRRSASSGTPSSSWPPTRPSCSVCRAPRSCRSSRIGVVGRAYEETAHYRLYRDFMADPAAYLGRCAPAETAERPGERAACRECSDDERG